MKKILFVASCVILAAAANAQTESKSAQTGEGTVYGTLTQKSDPVNANLVGKYLANNMNPGTITGRAIGVNQVDGSWVTLANTEGSPVMVKVSGFVIPKDVVGKTIVAQGTAVIKEVSEEMRKQSAQQAGMSSEEIGKIKGSEKQIVFTATGIRVI